jgi:hypothetical protein
METLDFEQLASMVQCIGDEQAEQSKTWDGKHGKPIGAASLTGLTDTKEKTKTAQKILEDAE